MTGQGGILKAAMLGCVVTAALIGHAFATELVPGQALVKSARSEFGRLRGTYYYKNGLVVEQIFEGMGIPNDDVRLADGNYLVSGCRVHSCEERSAIIATQTGTILMVGLLNFYCEQKNPSALDHACLTVFAKRKNNKPELLQELKDWADHQISIERVDLHIVP